MSMQPFPVVQSAVDLRKPEFQDNHKKRDVILEEFEAKLHEVASEGKDESLEKHRQRGQLLCKSGN